MLHLAPGREGVRRQFTRWKRSRRETERRPLGRPRVKPDNYNAGVNWRQLISWPQEAALHPESRYPVRIHERHVSRDSGSRWTVERPAMAFEWPCRGLLDALEASWWMCEVEIQQQVVDWLGAWMMKPEASPGGGIQCCCGRRLCRGELLRGAVWEGILL